MIHYLYFSTPYLGAVQGLRDAPVMVHGCTNGAAARASLLSTSPVLALIPALCGPSQGWL